MSDLEAETYADQGIQIECLVFHHRIRATRLNFSSSQTQPPNNHKEIAKSKSTKDPHQARQFVINKQDIKKEFECRESHPFCGGGVRGYIGKKKGKKKTKTQTVLFEAIRKTRSRAVGEKQLLPPCLKV